MSFWRPRENSAVFSGYSNPHFSDFSNVSHWKNRSPATQTSAIKPEFSLFWRFFSYDSRAIKVKTFPLFRETQTRSDWETFWRRHIRRWHSNFAQKYFDVLNSFLGWKLAGYEMIHINDLKNCSCALVFFGSCPKMPIAESEGKTKLK